VSAPLALALLGLSALRYSHRSMFLFEFL
jgi:hypothetical protein